jgi:hypothetical protein
LAAMDLMMSLPRAWSGLAFWMAWAKRASQLGAVEAGYALEDDVADAFTSPSRA